MIDDDDDDDDDDDSSSLSQNFCPALNGGGKPKSGVLNPPPLVQRRTATEFSYKSFTFHKLRGQRHVYFYFLGNTANFNG